MTPTPTPCRVVAVAAPMGAGKSTLSQALVGALNAAPLIAFDDYETATQQAAHTMSDWLRRGADFNALPAPGLLEAVQTARQKNAGHTVVFEMPLGRAWGPTQSLIDVLVWLDVPPDVALARRVRETIHQIQSQSSGAAENGLAWLDTYLDHYLHTIRRILEVQRLVVRPQADLILDGTQPPEVNVQHILHYLKKLA